MNFRIWLHEALYSIIGRDLTGVTLLDADGLVVNRIRGDLVRSHNVVIMFRGRAYVRTDQLDSAGFRVYQLDHLTIVWTDGNGE